MGVTTSCADCAHRVPMNNSAPYCGAPQLADLLDDAGGFRNSIAPCDPVRDFKHACGHLARWFEPRTDTTDTEQPTPLGSQHGRWHQPI